MEGRSIKIESRSSNCRVIIASARTIVSSDIFAAFQHGKITMKKRIRAVPHPQGLDGEFKELGGFGT